MAGGGSGQKPYFAAQYFLLRRIIPTVIKIANEPKSGSSATP
jgi:hypothetical protein